MKTAWLSRYDHGPSRKRSHAARPRTTAAFQWSEVELGNISVPLQITVADGGEDGRITWEGGKESTDYLPGRINVFQSKTTKMGEAAWRRNAG